MELYLDLRSQPCRSVYMFAKVVGIPFEFKLVDLAEGQQYSEEFAKMSPVRKVPVMKDGDFVLTESVAILQYLVQKQGSVVAEHWYPSELRQRARVNEYLSWQHSNLRAHGSKVFMLKSLFPALMGHEAPQEKLDGVVDDLNQSLDVLEQKFLQDQAFILGEKISLADVVAAVEIMQPVGAGLDVFATRPKLSAWQRRVRQQLGEELFQEAHKEIMNASSMAQLLKEKGSAELLKPKLLKMM